MEFVNLESVHSTGLSTFNADSLKVNLLALGGDFVFTFPKINLNVEHYNLSVILVNALVLEGDGAIQ